MTNAEAMVVLLDIATRMRDAAQALQDTGPSGDDTPIREYMTVLAQAVADLNELARSAGL